MERELIMNVITKLVERVEEYYTTNKKPCKSYSTESNAEKAANKAVEKIAKYYGDDENMVEYIVFFVPAMNRWTVAFNTTKLINKHGGYAGIVSDMGYFMYS